MDRALWKAKAVDSPYENTDWVEGHLLKLGERCYINPVSNTSTVKGHFLTGGLVVHEIDPSTLCQCTGVKDSKGNLIFEGDMFWQDDGMMVVEWNGVSWIYTWADGPSTGDGYIMIDIYIEGIEIIGNIHDKEN